MTTLVEYDDSWPGRFASISHELRTTGNADREIEHIGSTGLPSVPVYDK